MKILKELITFFIGLMVAFLLLEVTVRLWTSYHQYYDIEMWRYGTLLKQRAEDPGMSHRHIPNAKASLYGVEIETNSKGLRDLEYGYEKAPGVQRILFLGDSLTLGWGVPFQDIFAKVVERELNKSGAGPIEVINTGVGNYNSEQEWTYYRTEGNKYNPSHVMVLYFINDAEPTPVFKETSFYQRFRSVVFLWSRITKIASRFDGRKNFLNFYRDLYTEPGGGWTNAKKSLVKLRDHLNERKIPLTVFVCPELRKFNGEYPFEKEHQLVLGFLSEQKIDHVDLLPRFRENVKDEKTVWVTIEDSHPNSLGHRIIADGVLDHLRKIRTEKGANK
jgi:lysophospholipase L1-like esterase